jgi:phosphoribosylformylglycinamidine (FGAM) synthase PurS component
MPHRLEIALKEHLVDAEGEGICQKANNYFGIKLDSVRTIQVVTMDARFSEAQLSAIQTDIFTNPVTQISSYDPLKIEFDWCIWVGFRPGVRDNPGSTAVEAIEDLLHLKLDAARAVYTSKRYCIRGRNLAAADLDKIAGELLANHIIQQWKIYSARQWDAAEGIGFIIPKVILDHVPTVARIPVGTQPGIKSQRHTHHPRLFPE